jgi:hypothetical protein
VVADAISLRVLIFRPTGSAATVDASLREDILPALCARGGIDDAYVARHGDDPADRVLATVWRVPPGADDDEMSLLRARLPAETLAVGEARLDVLPLVVDARFERDQPPGILRIFRGTVRPGELDAYIDQARRGMLADAEVNDGLVAFYLGRDGSDGFLTVSAWTGWDAIEAATGGNIRQPFATKNSERLVAFVVDHYEILPDTGRPIALGPGAPQLLAS